MQQKTWNSYHYYSSESDNSTTSLVFCAWGVLVDFLLSPPPPVDCFLAVLVSFFFFWVCLYSVINYYNDHRSINLSAIKWHCLLE